MLNGYLCLLALATFFEFTFSMQVRATSMLVIVVIVGSVAGGVLVYSRIVNSFQAYILMPETIIFGFIIQFCEKRTADVQEQGIGLGDRFHRIAGGVYDTGILMYLVSAVFVIGVESISVFPSLSVSPNISMVVFGIFAISQVLFKVLPFLVLREPMTASLAALLIGFSTGVIDFILKITGVPERSFLVIEAFLLLYVLETLLITIRLRKRIASSRMRRQT